MKKIAVVTGASSGIGRTFVRMLSSYDSFDEVWVIARRKERLDELKKEIPFPVRAVALDLSETAGLSAYRVLVEMERPDVKLLVNCSGFGKFGATDGTPAEINLNMIDLNCRAVAALCQYTLPFMSSGAHIVNVASVAAFQPVPYINVYAATKAFVLSYSRGLNRELKSRGIGVTAVCPFWTKTEFFARATDDNKAAVVKKYVAMYRPEQIVKQAFRDVQRGKDVSIYGFKARFQTSLAKILPHGFVMSYWQRQQDLK